MEESSFLTPFGLLFISVMAVMLLCLPRKWAILPIMMTICYLTLGQRIVISGLNFYPLRILLLIGWLRLFVRKEIASIKLNLIDKLLICWSVTGVITATILTPDMDTFINRMGYTYNTILGFYLFRFLIRDIDEIFFTIKMLAIVVLPLTILMLIENLTGRNIFSVFGAVPELTVIRGDRLRCQGPFRHPILAGTFGATIFPYFVSLWHLKEGGRKFAIIGLISSTAITVLSASSGPLTAYFFALIGLIFWPIRRHMRLVRWTLLFILFGLVISMKAPIWFLIGRLGNIIGGTGWHRSELIDQAIKHFGEWWLFGTTYTKHWTFGEGNGLITLPNDPNMVDITNQYILIGVQGGIAPLILFILIIYFGFRGIGTTLPILSNKPVSVQLIPWVLGSALLSHTVSFLSVTYFDQLNVSWLLLLAMISTIAGMSSTRNNMRAHKVNAGP